VADLSPASQAVLDATFSWYDCEALYSFSGEQHAGMIAAAALRAAAHHLQRRSPWPNDVEGIGIDWSTSELHDIAAELEAQ
jgi:hypothetical protein